jgi:heterodisulfide reductase subunit A
VDTLTPGVFLAGTVQGPKDIPDTVAQASAAAARAIRLMNQGEFVLSPVVAFVHEEACDGCGACVGVCPVEAIKLRDGLATIGEACTGCGACISSCPKGALDLKGFSTAQLEAEVEQALAGVDPGTTVLVFADDMSGYRLADNVGTSRTAYLTESRIIRVPSGSRVTPRLILKALALGAGAVLIADSEEKSTPYPGSTRIMRNQVADVKRVLEEEGVEPERVLSVEFVTVMLSKFAGQVNELCALARRLGPIPEERRDSLMKRVDGAVFVDQG